MLTRPARSQPGAGPAGATLVELLVALTLTGIVLALVSMISVRQQRLVSDLSKRAALSDRIAGAAAILPIDLRSLSSAGGDILEARDTAIQIRATIASGVVCETSRGGLVLPPPTEHAQTYMSILSPPAPGDTVWLLVPGDSADRWRARRVEAVDPAAPGPCAAPGPSLGGDALMRPRLLLTLDTLDTSAVGSVLRITRPVRYSLYRAGDGRWYLGAKDWNDARGRFNTIQPVSGPFRPPSSAQGAGGGLVFSYIDSTGHSLAVPVADTRAIAQMRIELRGEAAGARRDGAAEGGLDSVVLILSLRNRR